MFSFDNIYLISEMVEQETLDGIMVAEAALGLTFPEEFKSFVTRLGRGEYDGEVYAYMPSEIIEQKEELQEIWVETANTWDNLDDVLPSPKLSQMIPLGGTSDGDAIAFHPDNPQVIYILPRNSAEIIVAQTFTEAIWRCSPFVSSSGQPRTRIIPAPESPTGYEFHTFGNAESREPISYPPLEAIVTYQEVFSMFRQIAEHEPDAFLVEYKDDAVGDPSTQMAQLCWLYLRGIFAEVTCRYYEARDGFTEFSILITADPGREEQTVTRLNDYLRRI